ncbi:hypothetical protein ACX80I_13075 [Arthrobacter sp. MDT3-44]
MNSRLAPIVLAAGLVAGAGPAVAAEKPNVPAPYPTEPFVLQDAFGFDCPGFDVTAQLTGKIKTIDLPGPRTIEISPGAKVTLTGVSPTGETGPTVTYVITGSAHTLTLPDGSQEIRSIGRNLVRVPQTDDHSEGLFLTAGNVNFALNADGSEKRLFSGSGTVTDVCAVLAP